MRFILSDFPRKYFVRLALKPFLSFSWEDISMNLESSTVWLLLLVSLEYLIKDIGRDLHRCFSLEKLSLSGKYMYCRYHCTLDVWVDLLRRVFLFFRCTVSSNLNEDRTKTFWFFFVKNLYGSAWTVGWQFRVKYWGIQILLPKICKVYSSSNRKALFQWDLKFIDIFLIA